MLIIYLLACETNIIDTNIFIHTADGRSICQYLEIDVCNWGLCINIIQLKIENK